jgi:hypothetical protein
MVLDNQPVFDNCMIKTSKTNEHYLNNTNSEETIKELEPEKLRTDNLGNIGNNTVEENNENTVDNNLTELEPIDIMDDEEKEDNISLNLEIEDLDIDPVEEEDSDALKEVKLDLKMDSLETLQLKKPNQVYFELYKEARNKAKVAKKNAILAYLEAKNIKKTYLIENINDSDSDFDAEIDDVSESELEGL